MRTIQRDIVGAVIESADGKILLGKSRKGGVYADCYMVPGGGIDQGEATEEALAREIREETGIDITGQSISLVDNTSTGQSEKTLKDTGEQVMVEMRFNDFLVRLNKPAAEVTIVEDDDLCDCRWFTKSELTKAQLSPPTARLLRQVRYL